MSLHQISNLMNFTSGCTDLTFSTIYNNLHNFFTSPSKEKNTGEFIKKV